MSTTGGKLEKFAHDTTLYFKKASGDDTLNLNHTQLRKIESTYAASHGTAENADHLRKIRAHGFGVNKDYYQKSDAADEARKAAIAREDIFGVPAATGIKTAPKTAALSAAAPSEQEPSSTPVLFSSGRSIDSSDNRGASLPGAQKTKVPTQPLEESEYSSSGSDDSESDEGADKTASEDGELSDEETQILRASAGQTAARLEEAQLRRALRESVRDMQEIRRGKRSISPSDSSSTKQKRRRLSNHAPEEEADAENDAMAAAE